MSVECRLCCKSLKTPGDKFPVRSRNKPRSLIDVASGSLPKSPVSLSPGDEVPHMFTRKPRLQLEKFCDQRCKKTFATKSAISGHDVLAAMFVFVLLRSMAAGELQGKQCIPAS